MDKTRMEQAIQAILPIVAELKSYEWDKIASQIDHFYSIRAARVTLDGSDLEKLNSSLRHEILGEPFIPAQKQSE